jgi:hypothetical protein
MWKIGNKEYPFLQNGEGQRSAPTNKEDTSGNSSFQLSTVLLDNGKNDAKRLCERVLSVLWKTKQLFCKDIPMLRRQEAKSITAKKPY